MVLRLPMGMDLFNPFMPRFGPFAFNPTEPFETSSSLTCSVCHSIQPNQHAFTRHIRTHNRVVEADSSGAKLFECGLCCKQLSSNSSLDRHMLVHSGERPFRCHICGTHFTTNGNMHRHIRGHYRNGNGSGGGSDSNDSDGGSEGENGLLRKRPLDLDDGDEEIVSKIARLSDGEDDINCPVCGLTQAGPKEMQEHLEEAHQKNNDVTISLMSRPEKPVETPQSSAGSREFSPPKFSLFQETKEEEIPAQSPHRCVKCGLSFLTVESWLLHLREHTSVPAMPLVCPTCEAKCSSIAELASHRQEHLKRESECRPDISLFSLRNSAPTLLTNFSASMVAQRCPPHSPLASLALPHYPTPPRPPVPSVQSHHLSHDEQFARDYRDMKMNGQYPCRLCKEVFANLRKLKSHNLIHMINPPYQCNLCSFVSNDKNTLKEHMKNHKGDTPYECTLCSLSFTTKANCERHIKNIHGRQTREEVKRCMTYIAQEDGSNCSERSHDTVCHVCSIDCKSRSVLRDHIRSSHPEGVSKPFSCKVCQAPFNSSSDTFRHLIQAHPETVSSSNLENFVQQQKPVKREIHDLSSVEALLSFSKLPLPISSSSSSLGVRHPSSIPTHPLISPLVQASTLPLPPKSIPFENTERMVSASLTPVVRTYTPPLSSNEDAPLDLSLNKKAKENDEEITVIEDKNEAKKEKETGCKTEDGPPASSKSTPTPPLKLCADNKPFSSMLYPGSLPLYPFQHQYPFLVNPFGSPPPFAGVDRVLLEQYQQELKRGLQLTSGGGLLSNSGNRFLSANPSSLQLSALALAASQNEGKVNQTANPKSSEVQAADLSVSSTSSRGSECCTDLVSLRGTVLVKKPKQRRYRTERPWRCDLCDKGFTLRSNMERHMKQQHPDVWQQRPTDSSISRLDENNDGEATCLLDDDKAQNLSIDRESAEEDEIDLEDDENELIIDDEDEDPTDLSKCSEPVQHPSEEHYPDLASVQKLLRTASCHNINYFDTKSDFADHREGHDGNSSCPQSPIPGNISSDESKKSAYSSAPQKQKCPFCHRKFPWSSSLVRHIRTHTGQKPYLCPVCHFPFTTKSNCDRHLQRKHPNSPHTHPGDRPYKCCRCPGASFTSVESLRKHDMFKHDKCGVLDLSREDPEKGFKCYICDARFSDGDSTMRHIVELHQDSLNKPHCEDSLRSPESENNNDSAEKDDPNSEVVSCMLCLKSCPTVEDLKKHVVTFHTQSVGGSPSASDSDESDAIKCGERRLTTEAPTGESSDFISSMLGTKPAVIDQLLTTKSTADAAKLLGVR